MAINLKETLLDLIKFKTVSGNDNQSEVLRLFSYVTKMTPNNYKSRIVNVNGFNSLIIEPARKAWRNKTVVLLGHVDVVNADEKQFEPKVKSGKIYGRGASDMKFAIAVFTKLISEVNTKFRLKIVLTSDEEIGGTNGTKYLQKNGEFDNSKVVILPDGGNDFDLVVAEKGVLHIEVTSSGKSSHGSKPWEGVNAIEKLIENYSKLKRDFNDFTKTHWVNTASIGIISGGDTVNTVPKSACMKIDVRFTENFTEAEILEKIRKTFKGCTVKVIASGQPFCLDKQRKEVRLLLDTIKKHTGSYPNDYYDHGASDARFFPKNTSVLIFKPLSGGHHTDKEWVDIKSLETYYEVLKDFLVNLNKLQP
ncbi:MAG: M20/M25/M40 family metallo-hydrolase [Candidatus Anstonellales archaeon]